MANSGVASPANRLKTLPSLLFTGSPITFTRGAGRSMHSLLRRENCRGSDVPVSLIAKRLYALHRSRLVQILLGNSRHPAFVDPLSVMQDSTMSFSSRKAQHVSPPPAASK